ncbi:hypothetical protein TWF481_003181 [Arthrobotrys musiformis]|uniref:BTB domain-containing protein n=1 Tax=Arthrobotrys musiformis TaxID=47236 RepID=A0AAV9VRB5_9PEZI
MDCNFGIGGVWNEEGFLNLFNNAVTADLIIYAGKDPKKIKYYANNLIISAASSYLGRLAGCAQKEEEQGKRVIEFSEINPEAMAIVLCWIYRDRYPLSEFLDWKLIGHIIFAASHLGLDRLGEAATLHLKDMLFTYTSSPPPGEASFTNHQEYWMMIRAICNGAFDSDNATVKGMVTQVTDQFPSQPPWVVTLAQNINPSFLAVLLLEREQRVRDMFLCFNCLSSFRNAGREGRIYLDADCSECMNTVRIPAAGATIVTSTLITEGCYPIYKPQEVATAASQPREDNIIDGPHSGIQVEDGVATSNVESPDTPNASTDTDVLKSKEGHFRNLMKSRFGSINVQVEDKGY